MAIKRIDESPSISDQIIFDILTTDTNGCPADPYKITNITISFLARDFSSNSSEQSFTLNLSDTNALSAYNTAMAKYCADPSTDNQAALTFAQNTLISTATTETFYYKNAIPVLQYGLNSPVWFNNQPTVAGSPGVTDFPILHITGDTSGDLQYGQFELQWSPVGMREGDYFICWSWNPMNGETPLTDVTLTSSMEFYLLGNTQITTAIPTHFTKKGKYQILLDRYLPEMFHNFLAANDLTPQVLMEFNNAVADGFTMLEDLTNQIVDLLDANATQEAFLPWLSNLFGLTLRSQDPTLWRRQIQQAVPVYKQKGTLVGLKNALAQAGITLLNYYQYWQTISPFTWQECFTFANNATPFTLAKLATNGIGSGNDPNFELYYRLPAQTDSGTIIPDIITLSGAYTFSGSNLFATASDFSVFEGLNTFYITIANTTSYGSANNDGTYYVAYQGPGQLSLVSGSFPHSNTENIIITAFQWHTLVAGDSHLANFFTKSYSTDGDMQLTWSYSGHQPIPGEEIRILYQTQLPPGGSLNYQLIENEIRFLPLADQRNSGQGVSNNYLPPQNWNVRLIAESNPYFSAIIPIRNPLADFVIFGQIRTEFPYGENIYNMDEYNGSTRDSTNPCHIDKNFKDNCSNGLSSFYNLDLQIDKLSSDRINEAVNIVADYTPFHATLFSINLYGGVDDFILSPTEDISTIINLSGTEVNLTNANTVFNRSLEGGTQSAATAGDMLLEAVALKGDLANAVYGTIYNGTVTSSSINIFCVNNNLDNLPLTTSSHTILEILTGVYAGQKLQISNASGPTAQITGLSGSEPYNLNSFTFRLSIDIYDNTNCSFSISSSGSGSGSGLVTIKVSDSSLGFDIRQKAKLGDYVYTTANAHHTGNQYRIVQFTSDGFGVVVLNDPNNPLYSGNGQTILIYRRLLDNQIGNLFYGGTILSTTHTPTMYDPATASNTNRLLDNSSFIQNYLVKITNIPGNSGAEWFTISSVTPTQVVLNGPQNAWTFAGQSVSYQFIQYVAPNPNMPTINIPIQSQGGIPYVFGEDGRGVRRAGNDIIENTQLNTITGQQQSQYNFAGVVDAANKDQIADVTNICESISYKITWLEEV